MSIIDERVLAMKFDNKQFETNVQTSMGTLEKLKQKLALQGATKGLENVDAAAKKISLDSVAAGVETIASKFSAMSVIGITALSNITSAAMNAGQRIVSALTIDPMKMGFQEYETQMNAIQTVLANTQSKGTTLTDVNAALDELNTYSDKTIYNFTEMARNIGTFTAAGVGLKTSTESIKGIANLAAVSGSNSQQASTAMYQLSQAIASGTVKLMDWNSVVNAGMGGEVFQKSLMETAKVHGIKIDEMIKKEGSFRETLQNGWLSSSILTETLSKFTGDLTSEQLKSMGYTDKQAAEILKLGVTASDAATKVKTFSQLQSTLAEANQSGWTKSWEIISGDFEEAKKLYTGISDVLGGMIGDSAKARNALLESWKWMGGRNAIIDAIRNAFDAAMIVVKAFGEAFYQIFPPLTAKKLIDITKMILDFSKGLKLGYVESEQLRRVFAGVFAIFSIAIQVIMGAANAFGSLFGTIVPANNGILAFLANMADFIVSFDTAMKNGTAFGGVMKDVNGVMDTLRSFINRVVDAFKSLGSVFNGASLGSAISGFFASFKNVDTSGMDGFFTRLQARFGPLGDFFKTIFSKIREGFGQMISFLSPLVGIVGGFIDQIGKALAGKITFKTLGDSLNVAMLVGIGTALYKFITSLTTVTDKVGGFKSAFKDIITGVTGNLQQMQANLKAKSLITIALAIGILALSLMLLASIDSVKLAAALAAMSVMFGELVGAFTILDKAMLGGVLSKAKMALVAAALITLSVAILILSVAVKNLSDISWEGLAKGLAGVVVLIGAMVGASKLLETNSKGMIRSGVALIVMALGLKILVGVVNDLGAIDTVQLAKGLVAVVIALEAIAIFTRTAKFDSFGPGKALGIILMAVALKILATAVEDFSKFSWEALSKGLTAIGIVLTELAIFTRIAGGQKNLISISTGMVIIAASMLIFAIAIEKMGNLSWEVISKGLTTMALSLAAITLAMKFMPKDMVGKSVGLVIVAAALMIISEALKSMGGMSWEQIAKGLLTLSVSLLAIAIAVNVMKDAIGGAFVILIVAGALAILAPILITFGNMSWESIGKGLLMLAGVFVIFGLAGLLLTPVIPTLLLLGAAIVLFGAGVYIAGAGLLLFAAGIAALAAAVAVGGTVIIGFVMGLLALIPFALYQLGLGLVAFATAIGDGAPAIVAALVAVLLAIIDGINTTAPAIISCLVNLVMMMVQALVDNVPKLVDAGLKLLLGILQGIEDNIYQITDTVIGIILKFVQAITDNLPQITESGANLIITFINSLADTINNRSADLRSAGGRLATAIIDGMTGGLASGVTSLANAAANLANSALDAAKKALAVNSPSKKFIALFESVGEGAVIGTNNGQKDLEAASVDLANTAIDGVKTAMSKMSSAFDTNVDVNPTIRPVVDLSNIHNASNAIDGIFGGSRGLDVSATYNKATIASLSGQTQSSTQTDTSNANVPAAPSVVSFTQNNYSPKALSRLEIYRNTRNQLSAAKGVVSA